MSREPALRDSYEVLIVGAGPAGAVLAHELASQSVDVCLIEKEKLPRYKLCGGGLVHKAKALLPFDISGVVEDVTYGITFTSGLRHPFAGHHDEPLIYMVMRDRFDALLVKKAAEAGATVLDGQSVTQVDTTGPAEVAIQTKDGLRLRGQVLVGADGGNSAVARLAGLGRDCERAFTYESEIPLPAVDLVAMRGRAFVDWGSVPGGYCWLFPKGDHLTAGSGAGMATVDDVRRMYGRWLEHHGIQGMAAVAGTRREDGSAVPGRPRGRWLRCRTPGSGPIASGRVLLVGEAAGLVDAFTGEGMSSAILSAQLAAPAIAYALNVSDLTHLAGYETAVFERILPDLVVGTAFASVFYRVPWAFHELMRANPAVWTGVCGLLRGELDYEAFVRQVRLPSLLRVPLEVAIRRASAGAGRAPARPRRRFPLAGSHA